MKSALLFAMCASLASAQDPFVNPLFYTSGDCTGSTDPASASWSYLARDGVAVRPFSGRDLSYGLSGYTINACLSFNVAYSVMLKIDTTACPGNGNNALQMTYWSSSSSCEGAPTSVTTLTAGTCVATPLGSARFAPSLTAAEICVVTNYLNTMQTGGIRTRAYEGGDCTSSRMVTDTVTTLGERGCGAEPDCTGCCKIYDPFTCQQVISTPSYLDLTTACNKVGTTWDAAVVANGYSDARCTREDNTNPALGRVQHIGSCVTTSINGYSVSLLQDLLAPLTTDIYCQFVQLEASKNVSGFLTWEEFRKQTNSAPAAHPVSVLALIVLLVTVML